MELERGGRVVPSALMDGVADRETANMAMIISRNAGFTISKLNYKLKKKKMG